VETGAISTATPARSSAAPEIADETGLAGELLHSSATHCCFTGVARKMAFHIFRRHAVYYWRRRALSFGLHAD
jgi:hypothetical protein